MQLETIYENEPTEREESFRETVEEEAESTPKDRWKLVYVIAIVLGCVQVLPWNVLVLASDKYFINLKFNTTEMLGSDPSSAVPTFSLIILLTYFISSALNAIVQTRPKPHSTKPFQLRLSFTSEALKSKHRRILFAFSIMLITFLLHTVCAMLDTSSWSTSFYWVTVVSVVILMYASGMFLSNTFGLFTSLPNTYSNALIIGNNVCGTLIAFLNLGIRLFDLNDATLLQIYAVYLFMSAVIILLIGFDCYCLLPLQKFFNYYTTLADQRRQADEIERLVGSFEHDETEVEKSLLAFANRTGFSVIDPGSGVSTPISTPKLRNVSLFNGSAVLKTPTGNGLTKASLSASGNAELETNTSVSSCAHCCSRWPPYKRMFAIGWPQLLTVWNCYFCTFAVYPGVLCRVQKSDPEFFTGSELYSTIVCLVVFNVFSIAGNVVAQFLYLPNPRWLWLAVLIRTVIAIPFFLFCNYAPSMGTERRFPVLVNNDWVFILANLLLGFTNGHFSSLAIMYVPRQFQYELRSWAGFLSAFFLAFGLVSGAAFSFAIAAIIQQPLQQPQPAAFYATTTTQAYT